MANAFKPLAIPISWAGVIATRMRRLTMTTKFTKADPKQAKLKIGLYGPAGSGKTFTALLLAEGLAAREKKRIAYVDTERGTDFYAKAVPGRKVHPLAFDFDALYTKSLRETLDAVKGLDFATYNVLVIDSISHIWEAAINTYAERDGAKLTKIGTIPIWAWASIKKPYKELLTFTLNAPMHVIYCGRQANVFEEDTDSGDIKKVGVKMRAEGETPYEPHILGRMEGKRNPGNALETFYCVYFEKDRTGVLSGKEFVNPNFDTFLPVCLLLSGTEQGQMQSTEEVTEQDAALYEQQEDKREKKDKVSRELMAEYQGKIMACGTISELGALWQEINKIRRKLAEEHLVVLTEIKDARKEKLLEGVFVFPKGEPK